MFLRTLLVAIAVLAGTSSPVWAGDQPGPLGPPVCNVYADSPHDSSGAGGVIAKSRFSCVQAEARTYTDVEMYLFLCTSKPSGPESGWDQFGCVQKKYAYYSSVSVPAGATRTRYVPPTGQTGAHGTGWWIQCTIYDPSGYTKASVPQFISA